MLVLAILQETLTGFDITKWLQVGLGAASFGLLAWIVRHLFQVAIPNAEARAERRDATFLSAIAALEERHSKAEHEAREWAEKQHAEVVGTQEKIRERLHNLANAITKDQAR